MYETAAIAFVALLKAYALAGAIFAAAFATFGVTRIDPGARGSALSFRLLIVPGTIALWPLLLSRWARGTGQPPMESNPHL